MWMVDGSCGWSEEIRWVELRFSPSRDPICPSYPIIAWDEADSRGSLRNIVYLTPWRDRFLYIVLSFSLGPRTADALQ